MRVRFDVLASICLSIATLAGCGGGSGKDAAPQILLQAPANLRVEMTDPNYGSLSLYWDYPGPAVDGFGLDYQIGDGPFQRLNTVLMPAGTRGVILDFNGNAIPECQLVRFRVVAVLGTESSNSNSVDYRRSLEGLSSLSADSESMDGVRLLINQGSSRIATEVVIERSTLNADGTLGIYERLVSFPFASTPVLYLDRDVLEGTSYAYRAYTVYRTDRSWVREAKSKAVSLLSPADVAASASDGKVSLTWRNRSLRCTRLDVHRVALNGLETASLVSLPPSATAWEETGLLPGEYTYVVKATVEPSQESRTSLPASSLVPNPPGSPVFTSCTLAIPPFQQALRTSDGLWHAAANMGGTGSSATIHRATPQGWESHATSLNWRLARPLLELAETSLPAAILVQLYPPQGSQRNVTLVRHDGSAWLESTIFSVPDVMNSDITWAHTPGGAFHFLFTERHDLDSPPYQTYSRKYTRVSGTTVQAEEDLGSRFGLLGSWDKHAMCISPEGTLRLIAFGNEGPILLSLAAGSDWEAEPIPRLPDLAWTPGCFSAHGETLHLVGVGASPSCGLIYQQRAGGNWTVPEFLQLPSQNTLEDFAVSPNGERMAISVSINDSLMILLREGKGAWQHLWIARDTFLTHASLAFDENNLLQVLHSSPWDRSASATLFRETPRNPAP